MTKKDYELIANAIYKAVIDDGNMDEIRVVASHLANSLQLENNKFDRTRFLQACGIGE